MKTFSIYTLGCKVNQYESQQIRELLDSLGLHKSQSSDKSDLAIINTCCVTHTATAKSRQQIRRIQKNNPDSILVVCGCLPTLNFNNFNLNEQKIHFVANHNALAATLTQIALNKAADLGPHSTLSSPNSTIKPENSSKIKDKNQSNEHLKLPNLSSFEGQTRAFLKVQDGCDGYCTYCIVPKTRPNVRSKPLQDVLKEAKALVQAGHREIVITGIFLGAYGQKSIRRTKWPDKCNENLSNLLEIIAEIPKLKRIRLSSLEPSDVTEKLLDIFASHRNIMPHLHLSLQSGSDAILKKMCRQYSSKQFREKVDLIKSRLDNPAITTDIIVGFPGETDENFEDTINLAKDVGFSKMHVFRFSPRQGTAAAKMNERVNAEKVKERSKILRDLDKELRFQYQNQFLEESAEVLIENSNGKIQGRAERYFMVNIENSKISLKKNDLVKVKLIKNSDRAMTGRIISIC